MNIRQLTSLCIAFFAISGFVSCELDTASGPTPYEVFKGETKSSSSNEIGKGSKTFTIPGSLPIVGSGRAIVITSATDTGAAMNGFISSYNSNNGTLVVNVNDTRGSGNFSNWKVVLGKTYDQVQDSVRQAYTNLGFGMFLHFNMSTFDRNDCKDCYSVSGEWGLSNRNPKTFKPTALDCGQWADIAKSAGCNYMVLTTKHHDGFCIWPSNYTNYCVKNASITTDICKAFVDSARSRGLRIGFYYSIRDLTNGYSLDFIRGQLTELLSNYGEVICLWFDGWGWGPGYKSVPFETVRAMIKSIQPNCMIVENNHEFNTTHSEVIEYEMPIDGPPKKSNILPAEGNEPIRLRTSQFEPLWFWHPKGNCEIRTAETIVNQIIENNSRNAGYLLDLTPDTLGLIPQCQADRMKEVGEMLKAKNITPGKK